MGWHELARLICLRQITHMRGLHLQKENRPANLTLWELGRAVPGTITVAHGVPPDTPFVPALSDRF